MQLHENDTTIEIFRPLLLKKAYYITGSMADAEDIVQDAYLQWIRVARDQTANPKAYLVRTVVNLAINSKTRQQRQLLITTIVKSPRRLASHRPIQESSLAGHVSARGTPNRLPPTEQHNLLF